MLVLAITAGIFVVVGGLLAYCVVRFRRRPDDDGSEPPQVYGSNQIELAWTVIPILIVFVLFLVTARTIYDVQGAPSRPARIDVTVVGHQWWWEFRYPDARRRHRQRAARAGERPRRPDADVPRPSSRPTSCTASGCRASPARPT